MKITKEDFEQWKANPVTEWFFDEIAQAREATQDYCDKALWNDDRLWTEGRAEMMRNAMRAQAEAYQTLLNMEPEEDEEDEEQERNQTD